MCPRSQGLRRHAIFELCDRISSRKRKNSGNCFCLFIWAQVEYFKQKNGQKSRDTVPLKRRFQNSLLLSILQPEPIAEEERTQMTNQSSESQPFFSYQWQWLPMDSGFLYLNPRWEFYRDSLIKAERNALYRTVESSHLLFTHIYEKLQHKFWTVNTC